MSVAQSFSAVNGNATPTALPPGPTPLPEAACSMNGFVKIGKSETRNHQVTGRGATPDEAAANYFGSLEALEAGYAARAARLAEPPPLASRTQRLALLLACGLEKAKGNTPRIERLLKACALVLAGCVTSTGENTADVRSQTEATTTVYQVVGRTCTCQDAHKHAEDSGHWCKHALAALFLRKLAAQERGE